MKNLIKNRHILIASIAILSSFALKPAIAQRLPSSLSLRGIAQFYSGLPHQDRALSMLQNQIDKSQPELLQADSVAANVWRNSEVFIGHEDILGSLAESDLTGSNPVDIALTAANARTTTPFDMEVLYGPGIESPTQAVITISQSGLLDDSVAGQRYRFDLSRQNNQWTMTRAGRQVRCQARRGHQNWSAEPCL
ncbi:MAG: hypothetical protein AAFN12_16685 [Cyanobacteria bacterium J06560_2]